MGGSDAVRVEQLIVSVLVGFVDIRDRDQDKMTALTHRAERRNERLKAFEGCGPSKSDDQVPITLHAIVLQGGTDLPFCQPPTNRFSAASMARPPPLAEAGRY